MLLIVEMNCEDEDFGDNIGDGLGREGEVALQGNSWTSGADWSGVRSVPVAHSRLLWRLSPLLLSPTPSVAQGWDSNYRKG